MFIVGAISYHKTAVIRVPSAKDFRLIPWLRRYELKSVIWGYAYDLNFIFYLLKNKNKNSKKNIFQIEFDC